MDRDFANFAVSQFLKRQIGNLGPNFDEEHVQLINKTIAIKEKLFLTTRRSHGIAVRSGNHIPRDDTQDYNTTLEYLTEHEAYSSIKEREFGDYDLPSNLLDHFDQAKFYRWISEKNIEATNILDSKI